jgi:hypothetical protein
LRFTDEGNVLDSEQPTPIHGAILWVVGCFFGWIAVVKIELEKEGWVFSK